MQDLDRTFRSLDEFATPDVWDEAVARRSRAPGAPQPRHRLVAAAVALAIFAAAGFLAWRALAPQGRNLPRQQTEASNYFMHDLSVVPHVDPRTGKTDPTLVDVKSIAGWTTSAFPGVHSCTWTVSGSDGRIVGSATSDVIALTAEKQFVQHVPVSGPGVSATAQCAKERLDQVLTYDVTDVRVTDVEQTAVKIDWNLVLPTSLAEGDWLSPNECTIVVQGPDGGTLASSTMNISAGPSGLTSMQHWESVPKDSLQGLSAEDLRASLTCRPFS
jgi:hypothetical protein